MYRRFKAHTPLNTQAVFVRDSTFKYVISNGEFILNSKIIRLLLFALLCSIGPVIINGQSIHRIDFGDTGNTAPEYMAVGIEDAGNLTWQVPPSEYLNRFEFESTRKEAHLDGVAGQVLEFSVGLPNGTWNVQLVFDSGKELTSTMTLEAMGTQQPLGWHTFRPIPPSQDIVTEHYRIWQGTISVNDGKAHFKFSGEQDVVRLMSLELVRAVPLSTERERWLSELIQSVGSWKNRNRSLVMLESELQRLIDETPDNAWAYWNLMQVEILSRVEEMYDLRGWEWVMEKTNMSFIDRTQLGGMLAEPILMMDNHPLEERARWMRARFLYHLNLQYGHDPEMTQALNDFAILLERYPDAPVLRMYNGEKIPVPSDVDAPVPNETAPEWSKAQLVSLFKLQKLTHYWILERQESNGELGGKWGDDVEALRFWYPLALNGDPVTREGWLRMANGVWFSPQVYKGFARYVDDVEHASEFTADSAPLLLLISDDTAYHNRAIPTLRYFRDLWTGFSPNGRRLFKSAWYSSTEIDSRPPRDRDVYYNTRTLAPLRYWLYRYGEDEEVLTPLLEHANAWVDLSERTDKGKPAGILPPSIRMSDESINGDEPDWHIANMYWAYYDFSGQPRMLDHLLFLWSMTGDKRLLDPIEASLKLVADHYRQGAEVVPGSKEWAASMYAEQEGFWRMIGQWRLMTNNIEYDDLIMSHASPYLKYVLLGDEEALVTGLAQFDESVGYNWPLLTEECMFTDRILTTNLPGPRGPRVNADIISSMLTGDVAVSGETPYCKVSWERTFNGFTALVGASTDTSVEIQVFNHGNESHVAEMRIWDLAPGRYSMSTSTEKTIEFTLEQRGQKVDITCPAGQLNQVNITRVK